MVESYKLLWGFKLYPKKGIVKTKQRIFQKYISSLDLETPLATEGINADIVLKFYLDTITILFTQYITSQQKHLIFLL